HAAHVGRQPAALRRLSVVTRGRGARLRADRQGDREGVLDRVASLACRVDLVSAPHEMDRYERTLRAQGFSRVAGVDEAGRGALAGPMVAAAVILPVGFDLEGIRDSKQLSAQQRSEAFHRINGAAVVAIVRVTPAAIDGRGLHRCNVALLRKAACELEPEPDYVLTDGFAPPRMPFPTLAVKKGDVVSAS